MTPVHYLNYFSINKTELYLILYNLLVYFISGIVLIVKKKWRKNDLRWEKDVMI